MAQYDLLCLETNVVFTNPILVMMTSYSTSYISIIHNHEESYVTKVYQTFTNRIILEYVTYMYTFCIYILLSMCHALMKYLTNIGLSGTSTL